MKSNFPSIPVNLQIAAFTEIFYTIFDFPIQGSFPYSSED